jgi:hypothetical protein
MEKDKQNNIENKFLAEKINLDKDLNCSTILYEATKCYIIFDSASPYFCKDPFQKYMQYCNK